MTRTQRIAGASAVMVALAGGVFVWAQERSVKEAEVPAAALAALQELSGGAAFHEFAEEIEYGHTFYEGSWKGPDGNIDGLVTSSGDVVEIEEKIPADKAPAAVRAAAEREAGSNARIGYEKKTLYLYEIHYKKDGKGREMIFTADGRTFFEHAAFRAQTKSAEHDNDGDEDDDEHEGHDDDDDD